MPGTVEDFVRATNEYPNSALGFFGADSLFVLSYLLVFAGLYAVTAERGRVFALVGLGAGVLTALVDAAENGLFIIYALRAQRGVPLTAPDLPLVYLLTHLKWMAAFATLYAFGLVFPRQVWLERIISGLMVLFPVIGVLGIANPTLILVRGLFLLLGMVLFAVYFWDRVRREQGGTGTL